MAKLQVHPSLLPTSLLQLALSALRPALQPEFHATAELGVQTL
jgi:hypothetical protein